MAIQHKDAPDGQRHEPKGISTAASGQLYVADGLGSGSWTNPITDIKNRNLMPLTVSIVDISTAGSYFVANPVIGKIYKAFVCLNNAVTTANTIVSFKINGVAVTGGNITVDFATSGNGVVFSSVPSGANTVATGGSIEVITDGGSDTSCRAMVTLLMDVT